MLLWIWLVHNLCWKLDCWLYIFTTTRANRVYKSFSLSPSVCQLNYLRTSKGLSLGSWYVSVVSTFPNTFALVLDSNLHDLNGTNPDWRCFQQNCHGAIFCAEIKVLGMTWNFTENIFGIYKNYWRKNQDQGAHSPSMRVGARLWSVSKPADLG